MTRPDRIPVVHLVDGTYELFRYHFAVPSHVTAEGVEVAATRGVLGSMLGYWLTGPPTSGGHRPGGRVVSQRPVRRLQDR
ncbi:MAG: hypothetical protein Ct9H300mP12_08130 [Acidimicrobiales bacterium]|nr:MAG: hypothetical protein Ct9H300mP12_08130 [Acidimicrobiales bacterium]